MGAGGREVAKGGVSAVSFQLVGASADRTTEYMEVARRITEGWGGLGTVLGRSFGGVWVGWERMAGAGEIV